LLIGKSASPQLQADINRIIEADPAIEQVFNVITFQMGPQVMLAAKIRMQPDLQISVAVENINQLEKRLKARYPEIGWCFIEPDNRD
jgi:divalent metal cation (Fe/Co/Zn/Cd) transporter